MLLLNVINLFKFSNRVIFLIFVGGIFCIAITTFYFPGLLKNQTFMNVFILYYVLLQL